MVEDTKDLFEVRKRAAVSIRPASLVRGLELEKCIGRHARRRLRERRGNPRTSSRKIAFQPSRNCAFRNVVCSPARALFLKDLAYQRTNRAIGHEDHFDSLRASLQIDIPNAQFLDGWNAIFLDEVPGISAALAQAAARMPAYAFSNSNPAHEACWPDRYGRTLAHFKKVFVSSTIGLRSRMPRRFHSSSTKIGVPAARVVFFDDSLSNVEGARACGLQAVHVTSHADVSGTLGALGL